MSYPPSDSKLDNSCYLIMTRGITALFHDLIGKADKDEERFYDKKSCKFKPINVIFLKKW